LGENTQNKGYYGVQRHSRSFKVGTNRKHVCDFLYFFGVVSLTVNPNAKFEVCILEKFLAVPEILGGPKT